MVMSKGTPYTQQSYKVSGEADMRAGGRAGSEAGRRAGCISLMRALFCKPCAWPSAPCIRHGLFHQAAALTLVVLAPLVCLPGCLPGFLPGCLPADSIPALRRLVAPAAVTAMATSHSRWAVVMSRNAGFVDQVRPAVLLAAA